MDNFSSSDQGARSKLLKGLCYPQDRSIAYHTGATRPPAAPVDSTYRWRFSPVFVSQHLEDI